MTRSAPARDDRTLGIVLVTLVGIVLAAFLWWRWHEVRAPRLIDVQVVLRGEGEATASDRPELLPHGARAEAAALLTFAQGEGPARRICALSPVMLGGSPVAVEPLTVWPSGYGTLRATWFTVEPALFGWNDVAPETADRLAYKDFLAPEMGSALAAQVSLEAHNDDFLSEPMAGNVLGAGVARLKVRVGVYRSEEDVLAAQSVSSPGAETVWEDGPPAVVFAAGLPTGIDPAVSRFLRLGCFTFAPGVWPDGGAGWPLPVTPSEAVRRGFVATPEAVAAAATGDPLTPRWRPPVALRPRGQALVLSAGGQLLRWEKEVSAGDALAAGGRFVVLVVDDGDGMLSAKDTTLTAWRAPARLAPLVEAVSDPAVPIVLLRRQ